MNYQLKDDTLYYQRFLKCAGLYTGGLDGSWGPKTSKADSDFIDSTSKIANQYGKFDDRSESYISTLLPKAQIQARLFLKEAKLVTDVKIISGTRTYAEQDALYAKGRNGDKSLIVTRARGGQSNHNFGIAWDIGIFNPDGSYDTVDANYISLSKKIMPKLSSIEWGGSWSSFPDYPHYQLIPVNESVSIIRQMFESGKEFIK